MKVFLNGADRFEEGDIRTVPDVDGLRFVAAGWAEDIAGRVAGSKASAETVDLSIDKITLGVGDSNG